MHLNLGFNPVWLQALMLSNIFCDPQAPNIEEIFSIKSPEF